MKLCVPVTEDGSVDRRFGKASQMAVATVDNGDITEWQVHQVDWDVLHDQSIGGQHHARIVSFLRDAQADRVVFVGAGAPMINTMLKMGLDLVQVDPIDAKEAVRAAAQATTSATPQGGCGCSGHEAVPDDTPAPQAGCGCSGHEPAPGELPVIALGNNGHFNQGGCGCGHS